jgi:hypothetical protein
MTFGPIIVDPQEKRFFSIGWNDFTGTADSLASSGWSISPDGTAITLSGSAVASGTATVAGTGFSRGVLYELSNKVVTLGGAVAERTIVFRCENI